MRIGIFSVRAFDRRLARLAAPISSGVRQGAEYPPPSGARSAEYPSGARVDSCRQNLAQSGAPEFISRNRQSTKSYQLFKPDLAR